MNTYDRPEPTHVDRPAPTAAWEVMPAPHDTNNSIHTVKRTTTTQWGDSVTVHYGRIDSKNPTTLRFGPKTARLLAEALLAAAEWEEA